MKRSAHKYFKRLVVAFIAISIIPLSLCIGIIIFFNLIMNEEAYNNETEIVCDRGLKQVDQLFSEYENIILKLSDLEIIKDTLISNEPDKLMKSDEIQTLMIGREGTIEIHLIDYDSDFSYGTNVKPTIYDVSIYGDWGIFYDMSHNPDMVVTFPNSYTNNYEDRVCTSMGKAILDKNAQIIGYIVIDIYRNIFLDKLISSSNDSIHYLLLDDDNRLLLDSTGLYGEGFRIKKDQKDNLERGHLPLSIEHGSKIFSASKQSEHFGFSLYSFMKVEDYNKSTTLLIEISLITATVAMIVCFVTAGILARRLYHPINVIVDHMGKITNGDLSIRMKETDKPKDELTILAKGFNQMLDYINYLMEKVVEQTRRQKNAEMKALQAQISPHFLYNMLNEIKALAKMGRTQDISNFVINLGKLLRHSISNQEKFVTVEEDMVFINAYLELQKIRYENSYQVIVDVHEDILQCKIQNLILQPIIENAILHGIDNSRTDQYIKLCGYREGESKVVFEIFDNGIGFDENYMQYINNVDSSASLYGGQGIENVQKRLILTYGDEYGLRIESKKGLYTKVIITIPYVVDKGQDKEGGTA